MARSQPEKKHQEDFGTEFEEKVLYINRCSKVVKGGRKFSFSALILIGDGQKHIGYGFAKANEVSDAIRKGSEQARKNVYTIEMEGTTIPHEVLVQWDGAKVLLKPAPSGTGVIAGSAVRAVLERVGVRDILTKSLGAQNAHNILAAVFDGLLQLDMPEDVAARRGKALEELEYRPYGT